MRRAVALIAMLALGTACTGGTDSEPGIPPITTPAVTTTTGGECIGWSTHQTDTGEWARDDCIAWMTR